MPQFIRDENGNLIAVGADGQPIATREPAAPPQETAAQAPEITAESGLREQLDEPLRPAITREDIEAFLAMEPDEMARAAGRRGGQALAIGGGLIPNPLGRYLTVMAGGALEGLSQEPDEGGGGALGAVKGGLVEGGLEAFGGSVVPAVGRGLMRGGVTLAGRLGPAGRDIADAFVRQAERMIRRGEAPLTFGDLGRTQGVRREVGETLARRQTANPTRLSIDGGTGPDIPQVDTGILDEAGNPVLRAGTDPVVRGGGVGPGLRGFTEPLQDISRSMVNPNQSARQFREQLRGQEDALIRNLQEERGIRAAAGDITPTPRPFTPTPRGPNLDDAVAATTGARTRALPSQLQPTPTAVRAGIGLEEADRRAGLDPEDPEFLQGIDDMSVRDAAEAAAEAGVQANRFFAAAKKGELQNAEASGRFAAALRQRLRDLLREFDPGSEEYFAALADLRVLEDAIESAGLGETVAGSEMKAAVRGGLGAGVGRSLARVLGADPGAASAVSGPAAIIALASSPVQKAGGGLMRHGPQIPTAVRAAEQLTGGDLTQAAPDIPTDFIHDTLLGGTLRRR